jgi:transcriptional regulator with PAS, ATPase and Fis domain
MASHFALKYSERNGKTIKLDEETLNSLQNEPWPGNIRELENFIERLALTDRAVNMEIMETSKASVQAEEAPPKPNESPPKLGEIEKELLVRAYEKHKSSYKVAKELGISQTAAYRKIKKHLGQ